MPFEQTISSIFLFTTPDDIALIGGETIDTGNEILDLFLQHRDIGKNVLQWSLKFQNRISESKFAVVIRGDFKTR